MSDTIYIQESSPIVISVGSSAGVTLSPTDGYPVPDWAAIQNKPDFDGLYYPLSNPSGFATGIDASSLVSRSETGAFYPAASNPSGYLTSGRITGVGGTLAYASGNYFVISGSSGGGLTQAQANSLYYPLAANPSGYLVGSVVRPDTYLLSDVSLSASLDWNAKVLYADGIYSLDWSNGIVFDASEDVSLGWKDRTLFGPWTIDTSPTGSLGIVNLEFLASYAYPLSNPSGFATGIDASLLVAKSETGAYTDQFYPRSANPSGYVTGSVVRTSETGSFINSSQTGAFYPSSNPSGYITGVNTGSLTSVFYPLSSNPSGYVTGSVVRASDTGSFITVSQTGQFYPSSNPSGFATGVDVSNLVLKSETGAYTGVFYPRFSNPDGYLTGLVVRPSETGAFLTSSSLNSYASTGYVNSASGVIRSDVTDLQIATGLLYPRANPSGYITGIDTSSFVTTGQTGVYASSFYPLSTNPSGYVTGGVVRPTETGSFITAFQTGAFYPASNPSGYATGVDVSLLVLKSETGAYTGLFYPLLTNPSSYVTGSVVRPSDTGSFVTTGQTGAFYPAVGNPSGFITGFNSGSYVLASQTGSLTGAFYPMGSNPSGYVTGNVVRPTETGSFLTSSQTGSLTGAFYPLASNPSGYVTGSVVRPSETGVFLVASQTGALTGVFYPLSANPSGYATGSVVRPSETGSFTGSFYPLNSNPSGYVELDTYNQVPSNYLPYSNFEESVDKLLWNKVTGDKRVFSTFDHATPSYIKNTSGLGADINLTCCSVWNSDYGQEKGGTLITPRHLAMAYHFPIATGSTLRFVTNNNQIITRTLTGAVRLGSTDIMIAGLDSDLPDTITPAQILPSGYNSAIFTDGGSAGMSVNRLREISVCKIEEVSETEGSFYTPGEFNRFPFFTEPVAGDSGGPVILLAGTQPIFLGSVHTTSNFDWISKNPTALNSALSQLGGGHSVSILDLKHYTVCQLNGTSLDIKGAVDASAIEGNASVALLQVVNNNATAISATSSSGLALDVLSVAGTAIQANTFGNSSIAVFAKVYSNQLEITSNGSLYFPQQSTTVSSSGSLLTGSSIALNWVDKSLSEQWSHASIASSSGHVANYHAVTGYSYPRSSNPSGYVTGNVVRPTETGVFMTSGVPSGAGSVSVFAQGERLVISGTSGAGGGLTQGQADALYYPLSTNPSGYVTGSVVRPTETGSFVTTSQTGGFNKPTRTMCWKVSSLDGSAIVAASVPTEYLRAPHSGTITKVTMFADATGNALVDIWRTGYNFYPPTVVGTMTSGLGASITGAIKSENMLLSGWSPTFSSGDAIGFKLNVASGITYLFTEIEYIEL